MTGVKKNFLKLTLDKSHFITEIGRKRIYNTMFENYYIVALANIEYAEDGQILRMIVRAR